MKEAFEKIIERLEEYKYSHLAEHNNERLEHCTENERGEHCDGIDCFWCVWERAIEIVKEVAEEYCSSEIPNKSDGWIPVSQRLPERQDSDCTFICFYLVQGYFEKIYKGFRNEDGEWVSERGNIINGVIAWQPLPEPYKPKGEQ